MKLYFRQYLFKFISSKACVLAFFLLNSLLLVAKPEVRDSLLREFQNPKISLEQKVSVSLKLAKKYVKINSDFCKYYLDFAAKKVNELENKDLELSFNTLNGQYFGMRGDIDKSENYFKKAQAITKEAKDPLIIADFYTSYAELKRRSGDLESVHKLTDQGLKIIVIDNKGSNEHIALLAQKGIATAIGGKNLEALKYFEEGFEYAKILNNHKQIALMCTNLGTNYIQMEMHEKALEYYLISMNAAKKLNDINLLGLNYNNLGMQYFRIKDFNYSKEYLFQAKEIFEKTGDLYNLSDILLNLGNLYGATRKFDSSSYYHDQSIALYRQIGDISGEASVLSNKGESNFLQGDYKAAKKSYQRSLDLYLSIGDSSGAIYPYVKVAGLELEEKNFAKAIELGKIAHNLSLSRKIYADLLHVYPVLIDAYKKQNNIQQALFYSEEFIRYKDTVFTLQNQRETSYKLAEFEYLEREKELEAAQIKKDFLSNQKIVEQRFLLYTILVALTGLSFIIFLLLKQNKNKKMAMNELEIKNKAIETYSNKLLETNQVKDRLFSIIAHDLRSPLASTQSILQLLKSEQINQQDFLEISGDLAENIKHTTEITENLLSWAKSQLKGIESVPEDYNIFNACERQIKLLLENKNYQYIVVDNQISRDLQCYVDPNLTDIIFRNLISNSLKFSSNNSSIVIKNQIIDQKCIISISDSGVGMDNEQLGKIKDRISFTSSGERNEKGTGLGLLICNDFIELMGGKLEVESKLGVGTTFTFDLPASINKPVAKFQS